jgi:hypothetical protein
LASNAVAAAAQLVEHFGSVVQGSDLAKDLVSSLFSATCDLMAQAPPGTVLTPELTKEFTGTCRSAVSNVVSPSQPDIASNPAAALILTIDTSVLCNYMVASIFYNPDVLAGVCSPAARRRAILL